MTGLMYNVSSFWPFKFLKRSLSSSLSNKMPNVYFAEFFYNLNEYKMKLTITRLMLNEYC